MSKRFNRNCPHNETYRAGDVTICRVCGWQIADPLNELATEFQTTPAQLRRDFENLEQQIRRLAAEIVAERRVAK